jgi:hypothetical protein
MNFLTTRGFGSSARSGHRAHTIKKAAERVGIDAASLAGHSLRSGLATTAARNGASGAPIMRQTGHRSVKMVRRYIREGSLFRDYASGNWPRREPRADQYRARDGGAHPRVARPVARKRLTMLHKASRRGLDAQSSAADSARQCLR